MLFNYIPQGDVPRIRQLVCLDVILPEKTLKDYDTLKLCDNFTLLFH